MVDNFELLNSLLDFGCEDDFYMLQVMKRRKENPDMDRGSIALKTVYLHRKDQLLELKDDIVFLCERNNARAYLNPNRKSFRKCTLACLKEFADRIANEDFHKPYKVFDSVAGAAGSKETVWVIDLDWKEISDELADGSGCAERRNVFVQGIRQFLSGVQPLGDKVVAEVPTLNGVHLLVRPFNPNELKAKFPDLDIHKNNPTLLYYGGGEDAR